jgi:retron-type reverse transcriptase
VLLDESFQGKQWVVETDVADCFGSIPHAGLMSAVEERISDRRKVRPVAIVFTRASRRRGAAGCPVGPG